MIICDKLVAMDIRADHMLNVLPSASIRLILKHLATSKVGRLARRLSSLSIGSILETPVANFRLHCSEMNVIIQSYTSPLISLNFLCL